MGEGDAGWAVCALRKYLEVRASMEEGATVRRWEMGGPQELRRSR